jgi:hypothetical protein
VRVAPDARVDCASGTTVSAGDRDDGAVEVAEAEGLVADDEGADQQVAEGQPPGQPGQFRAGRRLHQRREHVVGETALLVGERPLGARQGDVRSPATFADRVVDRPGRVEDGLAQQEQRVVRRCRQNQRVPAHEQLHVLERRRVVPDAVVGEFADRVLDEAEVRVERLGDAPRVRVLERTERAVQRVLGVDAPARSDSLEGLEQVVELRRVRDGTDDQAGLRVEAARPRGVDRRPGVEVLLEALEHPVDEGVVSGALGSGVAASGAGHSPEHHHSVEVQ